MRKKYPIFGIWTVTTEGGVEGRTVRNLGTHRGYVDEIAFALADRCYYSLRFKLVDESIWDYSKKKKAKVSISFDIDSGTWDMKNEERVSYFQKLFDAADRKVTVNGSNYYASVDIHDGTSPEIIARNEKEAQINAIKAKLTEDELKLLGLKK